MESQRIDLLDGIFHLVVRDSGRNNQSTGRNGCVIVISVHDSSPERAATGLVADSYFVVSGIQYLEIQSLTGRNRFREVIRVCLLLVGEAERGIRRYREGGRVFCVELICYIRLAVESFFDAVVGVAKVHLNSELIPFCALEGEVCI